MPSKSFFEFPEISDDDVRSASELLDLPSTAFFGENDIDPRKKVIQSASNLDVAACPGSGKTTVLVAKLAILAKKWRYRTQGICVLSHTNTARNEIERRLGNTSEGQRILSYPHFIGTIHKFVDEFLAIPWLRSPGYPVKVVETDLCEERRWKKIAANWSSRTYLEKQKIGSHDVRIVDAAFNVNKKRGTFPCKPSTPTYKTVQQACKQVAAEGYHCYDDMFVWANDLLEHYPGVRNSIWNRFPLLFLDEAQDNNEEQSSLLNEVFVKDQSAVIRQRYGDSNQAIYGFSGEEEATTYNFPEESIKISLPNSFRFGQTIANLTDPLGIVPYSMCGHGPKEKTLASGKTDGKHTIFVFDDTDRERILDAYGALLLETFSDQELREGTFTAIGMVHKQREGEETKAKRPRRVGDYWSNYDPEIARLESSPKTFVQYVQGGMAASIRFGETY
jgi:DNA helicase II / ATP-dependent DNA helicase PcrA